MQQLGDHGVEHGHQGSDGQGTHQGQHGADAVEPHLLGRSQPPQHQHVHPAHELKQRGRATLGQRVAQQALELVAWHDGPIAKQGAVAPGSCHRHQHERDAKGGHESRLGPSQTSPEQHGGHGPGQQRGRKADAEEQRIAAHVLGPTNGTGQVEQHGIEGHGRADEQQCACIIRFICPQPPKTRRAPQCNGAQDARQEGQREACQERALQPPPVASLQVARAEQEDAVIDAEGGEQGRQVDDHQAVCEDAVLGDAQSPGQEPGDHHAQTLTRSASDQLDSPSSRQLTRIRRLLLRRIPLHLTHLALRAAPRLELVAPV